MFKTLEEAREKIEEHVEGPGLYSHNMVSIILRKVDTDYGRDEVNTLVREFALYDNFGISEVRE